MKKLMLVLAATTAMSFGGAAVAQTWMSINARQADLDQRIDAGVRSGDLTRVEAQSLRADFNALAALEARYRMDGLSMSERADLDHRFDQLSGRVRSERADRDTRGGDRADRGDRSMGWYGGRGWNDNRGQWVSIDRRRQMLDQRIDQGLRSGQLTRREAAQLRAEFRAIARVEARYRRNGLSMSERADLDRRFDILAGHIRDQRTDHDRYGYNSY